MHKQTPPPPIGSTVAAVVKASGIGIGPGLPRPSALCVHYSGAVMSLADVASNVGATDQARCLRNIGMHFMCGEFDDKAASLLHTAANVERLLTLLLDAQWAIAAAVLAAGADHDGATADYLHHRLSFLMPDGSLSARSPWASSPSYASHAPHLKTGS